MIPTVTIEVNRINLVFEKVFVLELIETCADSFSLVEKIKQSVDSIDNKRLDNAYFDYRSLKVEITKIYQDTRFADIIISCSFIPRNAIPLCYGIKRKDCGLKTGCWLSNRCWVIYMSSLQKELSDAKSDRPNTDSIFQVEMN